MEIIFVILCLAVSGVIGYEIGHIRGFVDVYEVGARYREMEE